MFYCRPIRSPQRFLVQTTSNLAFWLLGRSCCCFFLLLSFYLLAFNYSLKYDCGLSFKCKFFTSLWPFAIIDTTIGGRNSKTQPSQASHPAIAKCYNSCSNAKWHLKMKAVAGILLFVAWLLLCIAFLFLYHSTGRFGKDWIFEDEVWKLGFGGCLVRKIPKPPKWFWIFYNDRETTVQIERDNKTSGNTSGTNYTLCFITIYHWTNFTNIF